MSQYIIGIDIYESEDPFYGLIGWNPKQKCFDGIDFRDGNYLCKGKGDKAGYFIEENEDGEEVDIFCFNTYEEAANSGVITKLLEDDGLEDTDSDLYEIIEIDEVLGRWRVVY